MAQICQTYSAQVIDHIKQSLLDGTLAPGAPLKETSIAAHLGISRGPVREALQSLLQQGLVTGLPQKAKFIRHLTIREIEESYCLGGTLEGACIAQSLEYWNKTALDELRCILDDMERLSRKARGLSDLSEIDEAFHDALLSRCHNRLMVGTARDSCAHLSKFLYYKCWDKLFSPGEFHERHKVIYEAVAGRDPQCISRVLLEHYAESGRRLGRICGKDEE